MSSPKKSAAVVDFSVLALEQKKQIVPRMQEEKLLRPLFQVSQSDCYQKKSPKVIKNKIQQVLIR